LKTLWKRESFQSRARSVIKVDDPLAGIAVKVGMFPHVWAITCGCTVQIHLTDESAIHQGIEAVVNRGQRNIIHGLTCPQVDFLDGWMIASGEKNIVDQMALPG
jgi:hypothetical protein